MEIPNIKKLIREQAKFIHYEDGKLWYQIIWVGDDDSVHLFDFPIPIDDAGGGKFLPSDRGLTYMRWIRKHLEYLQEAVAEGVNDQ